MKRMLCTLAILGAAAFASACSSTGVGATIGGVAGAASGHGVAGTVGGAAIGGVIGHQVGKDR